VGGLLLIYVVARLHRGSLPTAGVSQLPDAFPLPVVEVVAPGLAGGHVDLVRHELYGHWITSPVWEAIKERRSGVLSNLSLGRDGVQGLS
jgi:hypothetical protein